MYYLVFWILFNFYLVLLTDVRTPCGPQGDGNSAA